MKKIAVWILAALLALSVAASALGAADRDALNKTGRFYYTDEAKAEWVYYGSAVTKASQGDSAEIRAVAWGRGDELDGDDPELRLFVEDRDGKAMNVQKALLVIGTDLYELEFKALSITDVTGSFIVIAGENEKIIHSLASAQSCVAVLHCGDRELHCIWTADDLKDLREFASDMESMGLIGSGKSGSEDKTAGRFEEGIRKVRNWYTYEPGHYRFVIPEGWKETNLSQERTYLKAKFVPEEPDGTIITMSFYDLWGSYSDEQKARYERLGITRETSDLSVLSEKDVASALNTTEDRVRRETFGGCEFFVATSSDPMDVVMVYGVRNGYNISFQFSGTESSKHYPAFREMVESLEFLGK